MYVFLINQDYYFEIRLCYMLYYIKILIRM